MRKSCFEQIVDAGRAIARARGLGFDVLRSQDQPTTSCDPRLIDKACAAVSEAGIRPYRLPSGAGHDAVVLARHIPSAMLFLRCPGGVSHHPSETVAEEDVALGVEVLARLVARLAHDYPFAAVSNNQD
jgi:allantoate deiminase